MPSRAKRFYLCNLIPLWEIDERDMDVDWPVYHAYFGDLVEMSAVIKKRKVDTNGLKVRFEVYESDFLLTGGLNDRMDVFSSQQGFGDDAKVRPLKTVADLDAVPEAEREASIFLRAIDEETLAVRCWWRVEEPEGGDVKGTPEYYYDVFVEGKLKDGAKLDLEERSDHELEGLRWNVTSNVKRGRVTPVVDGEYAYLAMLQLLDGAKHSIHIANWKLDPSALLAIEPAFRPEYDQVPGLDAAGYRALLTRNKPLVTGVSARAGTVLYAASNGNVVAAKADGTGIAPVVRHFDEPTNLDRPSDVILLATTDLPAVTLSDGRVIPAAAGVVIAALVLDGLRGRLFLFLAFGTADLKEIPNAPGVWGRLMAPPTADRLALARPLFELAPTLPALLARHPDALTFPRGGAVGPGIIAGLIPIAGEGNPGFRDQTEPSALNHVWGKVQGVPADQRPGVTFVVPTRMAAGDKVGQMRDPSGMVLARGAVFIADTGNHCIRKVDGLNPANLGDTLATSKFALTTLAGQPIPGDRDDTGSKARFRFPRAIAFDDVAGRLIVADTGNRKLRFVNPATGAVTTPAVTKIDGAAGTLGEVAGVAFHGARNTVYVSERDRHRVLAVDLATREATTLAGSRTGQAGHADGAAADARFRAPLGLSLDAGLLFVADSENHVVRTIDVGTGVVATIGSPTEPGVQDVPVVLADVLRRKAAEGVRVRALLDGIGSGISRESLARGALISIDGDQTAADLHRLGTTVQAFRQDHVERIEKGFFGKIKKDQPLASNHEKMLIVDGRHGITGGLDFAPDKQDGLLHDRRHRALYPWHDVVALVEGPAAIGLEEHFVRRWMLLRGEMVEEDKKERKPDDGGSSGVRACFSLPVRHYESERLVLDASCSTVPSGQTVAEYRWEIFRRFPFGDKFEDVSEGTTSATDPAVRIERELAAGQYKIKLVVRASGGGEDGAEQLLDVQRAVPDAIEPVDRTDSTITEHEAESVRTWDPSPIFIDIGKPEIREILESYRRAIRVARHYVYLEHQYIYFPEIGDFLADAMREHKGLQVIWTIPLFTEETQDPYGERAFAQREQALPTSILDTGEFTKGAQLGLGGSQIQLRSQLAWHGFFRQHEMVEKLRGIDPDRFGVFALQRPSVQPDRRGEMLEGIYPHSKMILCDDRFFSIGSANANGRGFIIDGEHNVSALSPARGLALRARLWGEQLGYLGLAAVGRPPGSPDTWVQPVSGHNLAVGDRIRLHHQSFGVIERHVDAVDEPSGAVRPAGPPLDPALGHVFWRDPRILETPPSRAMKLWRDAAHSLSTGRKLKGLSGKTNAAGELVVPGHLAVPDDIVSFAGRRVLLDEAGKPKSADPVLVNSSQLSMKVIAGGGADTIKLDQREFEQPNAGAIALKKDGEILESERPYQVRVVSRPAAGIAKLRLELQPNLTDVPFDYALSWLARQPGRRRGVRAWEIDPPRGIEYDGPGSLLFSPWLVLPRLFIRLDPDEQARLELPGKEVRIA